MEKLETRFPLIPYDPDRITVETPWLVEGLWQKGKINGMAGFEKSGKSRLMGWILTSLFQSNQTSILGLRKCHPSKTLYLCGEETSEVVNRRLREYSKIQGVIDPIDVTFIEASSMRLDLPKQREWLIDLILEEDFKTVLMDPFRRLHSADEDNSTQMAPIHNDIRRWSNIYDISFVVVHHTPKLREDSDTDRIATWFRGSTDMAAILDAANYVYRSGKSSMSVMRQGRFAPLPPLRILDHGDEKGFERAD